MGEKDSQDKCPEPNSQEILNSYKGILDFAKASLTYLAVFIALTAIFGFMHLLSYLYFSDLIWLTTSIEYKTILTWGIPFSLLFSLSAFLNIFIHKVLSNSYRVYLMLLLSTMFILTYIFFIEFFYSNLYYIFFIWVSFVLGNIVSEYIDYKIMNKQFSTLNILTLVFLIIFLFGIIIMLGKENYKKCEAGIYPTYTESKDNNKSVYGVILNNSSTFVVTDLNKSYIIKILKTDELKGFIQLDEARVKRPELFKAADKNTTQNIDQNKSQK